MSARVVDVAKLRPGKCAISGEVSGPFIDTGRDVPRFGRIYLNIRFLDEHLRAAGYKHESDIKEMVEAYEELVEENTDLAEIKDKFESMVEAVSSYLPKVKPEVMEKKVTQVRPPNDDEIADWIERNGATHPVVKNARMPDKGSTQEWERLYGNKRPKPKAAPEEVVEDPYETPPSRKDEEDSGTEEAGFTVEVFDQSVDVDDLLSNSAKDVLDFLEEKPEAFILAVVTREIDTRESPRKSLLQPLGYWDDTENAPAVEYDEEE